MGEGSGSEYGELAQSEGVGGYWWESAGDEGLRKWAAGGRGFLVRARRVDVEWRRGRGSVIE